MSITNYSLPIDRIWLSIRKNNSCYATLASGVHLHIYTDNLFIEKCPVCQNRIIESLPISNNEMYKFNHNLKRGITLEFTPYRKNLWEEGMNIVSIDVSLFVAAKTCDCNQAHGRGRKVTYEFIDDYYSTCIDKRDIITAQLQACEKLLTYSKDENDK